VTGECRSFTFGSFDLVPEHSSRVPGSWVAAVVSVEPFAGDDVLLTVSVDVDILDCVSL